MKSLMKNCQCYPRVIYQARRSNRQSAANIAKILLRKSKKLRQWMDGMQNPSQNGLHQAAPYSTTVTYNNIQSSKRLKKNSERGTSHGALGFNVILREKKAAAASQNEGHLLVVEPPCKDGLYLCTNTKYLFSVTAMTNHQGITMKFWTYF